jgi:hypothetical protein
MRIIKNIIKNNKIRAIKMKYKNIIKAVKNGKNVFWANSNYKIIYDSYCDKYLIHSLCNNNYIEFRNDDYYLKNCYIK